jgi:hypothetical protein
VLRNLVKHAAARSTLVLDALHGFADLVWKIAQIVPVQHFVDFFQIWKRFGRRERSIDVASIAVQCAGACSCASVSGASVAALFAARRASDHQFSFQSLGSSNASCVLAMPVACSYVHVALCHAPSRTGPWRSIFFVATMGDVCNRGRCLVRTGVSGTICCHHMKSTLTLQAFQCS